MPVLAQASLPESSPSEGASRIIGVFLAGVCAFMALYLTQPILPQLGKVFHVGKAAVSLTLTATTLGVAVAAPLVGSVADRLGRKRVIVASAACLALATLLDASSNSLATLVFWRFLQGLFTPGVFAITIAYVQEEWAGRGGGRAMAIYVTGTVIGGFLGRMISGLIVAHWPWRCVFLVVGLLGGLGALGIQLFLPRERRFVGRPESESFLESLLAHLRNTRLQATFAAGFGVLFCLVATFTYATFHLSEAPFHLGPVGLSFIFCTYLFGAVVTPPCGRIIDRYGHRTAVCVAMSIGAAGLLLTLVPSLWVVVLGLALCCSGVFVTQATATSYIGLAAERDRAQAVGIYVTCYYVGGSAGAEVPGLLWHLGGWTLCVMLVLFVQLLTVLLALGFWKPVSAK